MMYNREFRDALKRVGLRVPNQINKLPASKIKGLLFQVYMMAGDFNSIDWINTQLLDYRKQIIREPGINNIIDHKSIQNNNHTFLNTVNKRRKMN